MKSVRACFVIFCACLALCVAPAGSVAATFNYTVPAASVWSTDTGLALAAGQRFTITASGAWTSGAFTGGPAGWDIIAVGDFLLLGAREYSLIGKIGPSGAPFFIGAGGSFTAATAGNLILSMNDVPGVFWDNSGSLSVSVTPGAITPPTCYQVIYNSATLNFANWQTNQLGKFFWSASDGAYHYSITDAADDYAFVPVPYTGGSFRLEFDVLPLRTDWAANFRLGLWDSQMRNETASSIYSHYFLDDNGRHIYLYAYWPSGSAGVRPGTYSDLHWYHNVIEYSAQAHTVSLTVTRLSDGQVISATAAGIGPFAGLDRIAMTSIGDTGYPPATAEGFIRNVVLSAPCPGPQCTLTPATQTFNPCAAAPASFTAAVDQMALVKVTVLDMNWRPVRYLLWEWRDPGSHPLTWDGRDQQGNPSPEGWYRITLRAQNPAGLTGASTAFALLQCAPPRLLYLSSCSLTHLRSVRRCPIRFAFTDDSAAPCLTRLTIFKRDWTYVRSLLWEYKTPGAYSASWDGRDSSGSIVPTGSYRILLRVRDSASQESTASHCCLTLLR